MKKLTLIISIMAFAFAAGACSKSARLPSTVTHKQKADATSGSVSLVLGDTLVVELPGNMTTGYQWDPLPIEPAETAGLVIVEGRYTPAQGKDANLAGAPGIFTYVLRTTHVGTQRVEFVYRRPFEKDKPPAKRYVLEAVIK